MENDLITIKTQKNEYSFEPKYWSRKSATELKQIIKILTQEANERIIKYQQGEKLVTVENQIISLKALGGENKKSELTIGKYQSKRKELLIEQARQLYQFHNWDFVENKGREKILESEIKRLESLKNNPIYSEYVNDLTEIEYRKLSEVMGSLTDEVKKEFGSNDILLNPDIIENIGKIDLTKIILQARKELKGKGGTTNDLKDLVSQKIQEELQRIGE